MESFIRCHLVNLHELKIFPQGPWHSLVNHSSYSSFQVHNTLLWESYSLHWNEHSCMNRLMMGLILNGPLDYDAGTSKTLLCHKLFYLDQVVLLSLFLHL